MKSKLLLLTFTIALFYGCNQDGGGSQPSVDTLLGDAFEIQPTASGQVQVGQCFEEQHAPLPETIVRKIDIAIVIDTSGSIVEERDSIASGFDYFLSTLPAEVDYRVAVILGHGPGSNYDGVLYQNGTDPKVLDSQIHDTATVISHLRTKMANPHVDNATDGGEMGVYSLTEAITTNLAANQADGFFRDDAALAVVFVADEQDICAEFPADVVPVADPQGAEINSYNNYCVDAMGQLLYHPQQLLNDLNNLKADLPMMVGGVIYNNSATIPFNGENEIGYGYKEAIELAGGISVDLASGDYGQGLINLGKLAQVSVAPANDFPLATNKVDPSTIQVLVNNSPADYTYDANLNLVSLVVPRQDFDIVNINYCEKEELPKQVTKLISGGNHNCAVQFNGKLKCWGANSHGQLGYGHANNIGDDELPSSVAAIDFGQRVIDGSAGLNHTCVLLEDGSVRCFGDNSAGQLGYDDNDNRGISESADMLPAVNLGRAAIAIYSGTKYNCALLDDQSVKCWGENRFGQLGYGDTNNRGDALNPMSSLGAVPLGDSAIALDISTVSNHTCAVLKSNDSLKCWGFNANGQLGYGHTNHLGDDELPSSYGSIPFAYKVLQVATGLSHTCALTGGQDVQCWGANNNGQAGYGPGIGPIGDDEAADSAPFLDFSNNGSKMVSTGIFHSCVIGLDEAAYCFGRGADGQTGHGNTATIGINEVPDSSNSKVPIDLALSQVTTGASHSCVLTKDEGRVICFGLASSGQLGYGNTNKIGDDEAPWEFVDLISPIELP